MLLMYWPMIVWWGTLEATQEAFLKTTQGGRRARLKIRK